jgi:hypothetical protein
MTSTTTQLDSEFLKGLFISSLDAFDEGTKMVYQAFWHSLITYLSAHLIAAIFILIVIFVLAIARYLKTGRWAVLGSVLYWYFYLGVLLIIGLIWGSDIFVSDLFHLVGTIILNPICYFIVGVILDKTGLHKQRFSYFRSH